MEHPLKIERFLDAKKLFPCLTVVDFMLSSHNKKIDTGMVPKMHGNWSKIDLKAAWGHLFFDFRLWSVARRICFFDAAPVAPECSSRVWCLAPWVPAAATRARRP